MAWFHVLIEGRSLGLTSRELSLAASGSEEVGGFYCWRRVKAVSPGAAGQAALELVRADWAHGEYARFNRTPSLRVAEVKALSWVTLLRARDSHCAFFAQ